MIDVFNGLDEDFAASLGVPVSMLQFHGSSGDLKLYYDQIESDYLQPIAQLIFIYRSILRHKMVNRRRTRRPAFCTAR